MMTIEEQDKLARAQRAVVQLTEATRQQAAVETSLRGENKRLLQEAETLRGQVFELRRQVSALENRDRPVQMLLDAAQARIAALEEQLAPPVAPLADRPAPRVRAIRTGDPKP